MALEHSSRTPYGVRGLKLRCVVTSGTSMTSHPVWGAWIEIAIRALSSPVFVVAPRMGCVD